MRGEKKKEKLIKSGAPRRAERRPHGPGALRL